MVKKSVLKEIVIKCYLYFQNVYGMNKDDFIMDSGFLSAKEIYSKGEEIKRKIRELIANGGGK